ncbi:hypothetical protein EYZ11_011117 [Aspergillus tanneri]|uniref:Uncharacterized protein n=1 Tax=Aspergillus tanneri TaxID=1220188 RepID=A0A4S3J922_9EURO|nr:hypothetical protein EYZ11_011117 [Aspergillus tanneri]
MNLRARACITFYATVSTNRTKDKMEYIDCDTRGFNQYQYDLNNSPTGTTFGTIYSNYILAVADQNPVLSSSGG